VALRGVLDQRGARALSRGLDRGEIRRLAVEMHGHYRGDPAGWPGQHVGKRTRRHRARAGLDVDQQGLGPREFDRRHRRDRRVRDRDHVILGGDAERAQ
jgi:hypothetical protein